VLCCIFHSRNMCETSTKCEVFILGITFFVNFFFGFSIEVFIFSHCYDDISLKRHGNEADFLGFLQNLVPHNSFRLPFELFRFWLRIRVDICNRKMTPRLGESESRLLKENSGSLYIQSEIWLKSCFLLVHCSGKLYGKGADNILE
ncbi:MAG: hypothetical protein ACK559_27330, partial [bacterium]